MTQAPLSAPQRREPEQSQFLRRITYRALRLFLSRVPRRTYPAAATLILEPEADAHAVRDDDGALHLTWKGPSGWTRIYAGTDPDRIDRTRPITTLSGMNEARLDSLDSSRRLYFEIAFESGASLKAAERVLPLRSAPNFRDVGGYRTMDGRHVRWGKLFRAGALGQLSDEDARYLQDAGLRTICDLRSERELGDSPDRTWSGATRHSLPVFGDKERGIGPRQVLLNLSRLDEVVARSYTELMIDRKARVFGNWLRILAEPGALPVVVHCSAGKDRTGVAIALVLALLGVDEDTIIADYSLSNAFFEPMRRMFEKYAAHMTRLGTTFEDVLPLFTADPANLRGAFAHLKAVYGTVDAYLTGPAGVDSATLARLRESLVE
ncbi:MAG: tyrosine-protein phosphatase [Anaerolineae bacterium]|nr:tyrosine-protein phosphatase [Anaerolineae bacterium]